MSRTYQLLTFETFSVHLPVNNNERVGPSKRSAAQRGGKDAEGCLRELRTTALRGHAPPHCASLQSSPCAGPAKLQVPQSLAAPHNCVHRQQTSGRRLAPRQPHGDGSVGPAQPSPACKARRQERARQEHGDGSAGPTSHPTCHVMPTEVF